MEKFYTETLEHLFVIWSPKDEIKNRTDQTEEIL